MKKERGWEFLFLAANIDAVETAAHLGVGRDRAVNYKADSVGTTMLYETVSDAVSCVRASAPLAPSWGRRLNEDVIKKGKAQIIMHSHSRRGLSPPAVCRCAQTFSQNRMMIAAASARVAGSEGARTVSLRPVMSSSALAHRTFSSAQPLTSDASV